MTLGNNIKKYRKMLKLSQEDLAKKSNLYRNSIYNYENNKRQPSIETLNKIATALGVTVNDLIKNNTIDITNMNDEKLSSKTIPELFSEMCDIMCNELCKYADTVDENGMCELGRSGEGCPLHKFF